MKTDDQKALGRAFLTAVGPQDVIVGQDTPKPLRPQSRRLARELAARRLREVYLSANTWLASAAVLWLASFLVPPALSHFDGDTLTLCLRLLSLIAVILVMLRGLTMARGLTIPKAI